MTPFQKSALTIAVDWLATEPTDLSSWAAQGRRVRVMLEAALAEPDAKREPATDATDNRRVWDAYIEACREFERFHGIRLRKQQPGAAGMLGAEADLVLTDAIGRQPCRYPACQDADGRCPRIFAGECSGPGGVVA